MKIPFFQKLENQLLTIFDLSHQGQTFTNHLSTNVIRITVISLAIYCVECQYFSVVAYLLGCVVIVMLLSYYRSKTNNSWFNQK